METISTHLITNNYEWNRLISARKARNKNSSYNQAAGDINRNATKTDAEYERDACEEELYRLRFGLENLLLNNDHGDFKAQQQQQGKLRKISNPFRTTANRTTDSNRKNPSWFDRCCSPCCRRWRRNRYDNSNHHIPNDRNHGMSPRRTSTSPYQQQLRSDPYVSASPSPSISSGYIDPNTNHTKNDLKHSIDHLISRNQMHSSDLLTSKNFSDSQCQALTVQLLEAKALDCLCSGYSKRNTQKQIDTILSNMNQRFVELQSDSVSRISSQSSPVSDQSSSVSLQHISPQISSQDIPSPSSSSLLKSNDSISPSKKNSKVTIAGDRSSKSKKSKHKKRSSSKKKRSTKNISKQPRKSTSRTKQRSKSKVPNKGRSSSKLKKQGPVKSSTRSKSSKTSKSKSKRSAKKKRTKPKSNNQMNDYTTVMIPTSTYPQAYQDVYRNRQNHGKILLSST